MGSIGLDKRANSRTLHAPVREDMTFVGHIPDKWRAATASREPNTIGNLSGTLVGISASTLNTKPPENQTLSKLLVGHLSESVIEP